MAQSPELAESPDPSSAGSEPAVAQAATPGARAAEGNGVRFAEAAELRPSAGALDAHGMLVVRVDSLDVTARGRLSDVVDDAVESALGARGSPGPSVASATDRDAALSDQLYRARRTGAGGIAIVLPPLGDVAGPSGALAPEDCAVLRFLARGAADRPVRLVLDAGDASIGGYGDPVALRDLLTAGAAPPVRLVQTAIAAAGTSPERPANPPGQERSNGGDRGLPETQKPAAQPEETLGRQHTAGAHLATHDHGWQSWTLQLAAARGPQPLAALERLFADSYVPLSNAIVSGLDDPRARASHDEFRAAFTRSYADAFPTFAATTKRPRMVLDVHEVAGRIARLHGARSTRLLLVDAMRLDLSRLVAQRVTAKLGARAALTDELVLWSALPTTTMRQLETIARGVEALRAPAELDEGTEPMRGRTAEYVRRLRVGPREIHKLDLVQSRVLAARGGVLRALPEIAEATADVIARHAETLSPHTLLFVFGDHGFTVDRSGNIHQGGASPEEVVVGAFALLVGDVH